MSRMIVLDKMSWSTKLKTFFYAVLFWMGVRVCICQYKISQAGKDRIDQFLILSDLAPRDLKLWMGTVAFIQKQKCQKYCQESKQLWFNRLLSLVDLGIFFGMIHLVASVTFICHYVFPQPFGDLLFWIIAVMYVLVYVPFRIYRKQNRKKLV